MTKDELVYVGHMLDCTESVLAKVQGLTREQFDADDNLQLAVAQLIQTLGEAANRVAAEFQQQHPQVPWRQIVGMRNRIVHDYIHVDFDVIWQVVTTDLEPLRDQLRPLLP